MVIQSLRFVLELLSSGAKEWRWADSHSVDRFCTSSEFELRLERDHGPRAWCRPLMRLGLAQSRRDASLTSLHDPDDGVDLLWWHAQTFTCRLPIASVARPESWTCADASDRRVGRCDLTGWRVSDRGGMQPANSDVLAVAPCVLKCTAKGYVPKSMSRSAALAPSTRT